MVFTISGLYWRRTCYVPKKRYIDSKLCDLKVNNYLYQPIGIIIMEIIMVWDTTKTIWDLMHTKYQGSTRWSVLNCKYYGKSLNFLQWKRWIYWWILCKNSCNFKWYDCSWWEIGTNFGGCKDTEIINKKVQLCGMLHRIIKLCNNTFHWWIAK